MSEPITQSTNFRRQVAINRVIDGKGTAKTIGAIGLFPDETPALEDVGFHSPTIMYCIFEPDGIRADYDKYRLIREYPHDGEWLHEEFDRLKEQLTEQDKR